MALYGQCSYWNARYASTPHESYEWYQGYRSLRRLLNPIHFATQSHVAAIKPQVQSFVPSAADFQSFPTRDQCRVLVLGCGNSTFSEDMLLDGWMGGIVNVDFSETVVSQMEKKYSKEFYTGAAMKGRRPLTEMEFICADITKELPFEANSFDLIVCKGSFDAVLCSAGSVSNARKLVEECVRLLVPGRGIFFLVTYANPDNRIVFLEHEHNINFYWEGVTVHTLERPVSQPLRKSESDFVYICRKRACVKWKDSSKENESNSKMVNGLTKLIVSEKKFESCK